MPESMKDFFENSCRVTMDNQIVCVHGNDVRVLSPLDEDMAEKKATKENIKKFFEENESYKDVEE